MAKRIFQGFLLTKRLPNIVPTGYMSAPVPCAPQSVMPWSAVSRKAVPPSPRKNLSRTRTVRLTCTVQYSTEQYSTVSRSERQHSTLCVSTLSIYYLYTIYTLSIHYLYTIYTIYYTQYCACPRHILRLRHTLTVTWIED